jgi:ribosomal protein L19E
LKIISLHECVEARIFWATDTQSALTKAAIKQDVQNGIKSECFSAKTNMEKMDPKKNSAH